MKKSVLVGFGALVVAALLLAPMCALAADWNMYGSARVKFFYNDYSKEANAADPANSDNDLDMGVVGNSRIGANVKASDAVAGRFEYGASNDVANIRLLYGDWNFGSGTLRFGQDYCPISPAVSNQVIDVDDAMAQVGAVDTARTAQIKLIMGGLQVALIGNQGTSTGTVSTGGLTQTDISIPKIEASYEIAAGMFTIIPFVGYQSFSVEGVGAGRNSETITSYVVGAHGLVNLGPAYINFSAHYTQNGADYGLTTLNNNGTGNAQYIGSSIEDSTGYGGALIVGFKPSQTLQLEAGVGYVKNEVDLGGADKSEDDTILYYAQAAITLAPGVYIVPEIGVYDYGDYDNGTTKTKEGQRLYYGAKFQIDF